MNVEQMEELVRFQEIWKWRCTGPLMYVKIHMKRWNNVSLWDRYDPDQRTERFCMEWKRNVEKSWKKERKAGSEILAGAGINPGGDQEQGVIWEWICRTENIFICQEKIVKESRMEFRRQGVPMGMPGMSEFETGQTDEEAVREAVKVLKEYFRSWQKGWDSLISERNGHGNVRI